MKTVLSRIAQLQGKQSLREFCKAVGLNYDKIKKYRQRKSMPDTQSLMQIASHFRADINWLITGKRAPSKLNQRVAAKLKLIRKRKGWTQEQLAKKLSIPALSIPFLEKGSWNVSTDLLQDLSKKLGLPAEEWFLEEGASGGQVPELKIFQTSSTGKTPKIRNEDYVSIPLTDSAIAAGQPIIQENNIEDYVLLHIRAAGKKGNLVASRVDGDSMEPMLHSGDIVVIDRDDKKISKNKMYAIFYEEGLTAKYVERQKNLLVLRPINPNSQVQIVNLNEHPDPIVGRIIGAWKEL